MSSSSDISSIKRELQIWGVADWDCEGHNPLDPNKEKITPERLLRLIHQFASQGQPEEGANHLIFQKLGKFVNPSKMSEFVLEMLYLIDRTEKKVQQIYDDSGLQGRIKELETENKGLKERVESLEAQLGSIDERIQVALAAREVQPLDLPPPPTVVSSAPAPVITITTQDGTTYDFDEAIGEAQRRINTRSADKKNKAKEIIQSLLALGEQLIPDQLNKVEAARDSYNRIFDHDTIAC